MVSEVSARLARDGFDAFGPSREWFFHLSLQRRLRFFGFAARRMCAGVVLLNAGSERV